MSKDFIFSFMKYQTRSIAKWDYGPSIPEQIISSKVYQAKRQFRLLDSNEMILRRRDAIQLRKYISNVIPSLKAIELRLNAPAISLTLLFIARARAHARGKLFPTLLEGVSGSKRVPAI